MMIDSKKRNGCIKHLIICILALISSVFMGSIHCEAKNNATSMSETNSAEVLHFVDAWGEWHDTVIDKSVPKHSYDFNKLKRNGMKLAYDDGVYSIQKGIDVSHHQGNIDWKKVKAAGYDFAILRCAFRGYGESGSLNADKMFSTYAKEAVDAGLDIGVYVFSQAINEAEAVEEAEYVLDIIKDAKIKLPVVYDPELIRDDTARTDNVTGEQFTKNTIAFCKKIKSAGYQPMIYSNMVWEAELFDMKKLSNYKFWYADYEKIPQTPYAFEYWQYSEKGMVDGVNGEVDLDVRFIKKH